MFTVRLDLRNPPFTGLEMADLYEEAIAMAAYAEEHGASAIILSEHHAADDGHLASPLTLAAAISARTTSVPIVVAALLVPLHDPVRLAEDMISVDLISKGRVSYVAGLGYRREEFEMFDREFSRRGKRMEECLGALLDAFREERFEFEGRPVYMTPRPFTPGGPVILYGGGSEVAARRAARFELPFFPQSSEPALIEAYERECRELGHEPAEVVQPTPGAPMTVIVTDDVDATWAEVGPNLLHEATTHAEWMGDDHSAASSFAESVDALRAEGGTFRVVDVEGAVDLVREFGSLNLHPMCGGLSPEVGWRSLRLAAEEAMPRV